MRPHRKLDVWKRAIDFVVDIYQLTKRFPNSEQYVLCQQLRRAAISIPSNIAEGAGRQTRKEFIQFLHIAQGSASEVDTQLEIAYRLGYLREPEKVKLNDKLDDISKMIIGLQRYLEKSKA